ncbi:hypothetical protein P872_05680 [Rhodonellum psychrophilum GCM71 = DSM 17998]|uniref:Uncharacterized protein n=1 Tax=Rhodonellum psychrophilum GCM71 = DSM 17998 TaxID=1123057 RepID=U5BY66_9BACT|nr:hypothetical protein P872_05680 [Rhodonellum psychrophilum GCM71 = DSM 17998]
MHQDAFLYELERNEYLGIQSVLKPVFLVLRICFFGEWLWVIQTPKKSDQKTSPLC